VLPADGLFIHIDCVSGMDLISIIQVVIFVVGTVILVLVLKRSLQSTKYHGFYRFFVFEISLSLIILNFPHWFENPFSFLQIISWILLSVSLLFLVQSIYFFTKYGGGSKKRKDYPANFGLENTVALVKEGIYKYIRHPMYGSLLFLALGAMFKYVSIVTVLLAVSASIFVIFTARTEEKENIKFFGPEYENYIKETRMFIPFVF
jgi:protein-S-isoprenylcysteine O-methyltransferase Ste14